MRVTIRAPHLYNYLYMIGKSVRLLSIVRIHVNSNLTIRAIGRTFTSVKRDRVAFAQEESQRNNH